jgi:hypothetical protein
MGHLHRITKLYVSNGPWPLPFPITEYLVLCAHVLFLRNRPTLITKTFIQIQQFFNYIGTTRHLFKRKAWTALMNWAVKSLSLWPLPFPITEYLVLCARYILEYPSSGTVIVKRLESKIIQMSLGVSKLNGLNRIVNVTYNWGRLALGTSTSLTPLM